MFVTAGLVIAHTPSHAQPRISDLPVGARIRVWAPSAGVPVSTTAVLDSVRGDSLYIGKLREPPALRSMRQVAVPLTSIVQLDESAGRRSRAARARKGALWGLGAYALLAGTYIVHETNTCGGTSECFGEGMAWIGLIGALPWSAAIGAAIGLALPVERWRQILPPMTASTGVSVVAVGTR